MDASLVPTDDLAALPLLGMHEAVTRALTTQHWEAFERHGYLPLGPICDVDDAEDVRRRGEELGAVELRDRFDEIALRPLLELLHHPLLHEVCAHVYGPVAPVALLRAVVMCGAADGRDEAEDWWRATSALGGIDREVVAIVVVGLGEGPTRRAVFEVVEGSHRPGSPADVTTEIDLEPGNAMVFHGRLLHRRRAGAARAELAFWFVGGCARDAITGGRELPMFRGERMPE